MTAETADEQPYRHSPKGRVARALAIAHARQGNWSMAERFATKAARHRVVAGLVDVAEIAIIAGQLDYAARLIERAIKRGAPDDCRLLLLRILALKGLWHEAERACLASATPSEALRLLAGMRVERMQLEEARRLTNLAAELESGG